MLDVQLDQFSAILHTSAPRWQSQHSEEDYHSRLLCNIVPATEHVHMQVTTKPGIHWSGLLL